MTYPCINPTAYLSITSEGGRFGRWEWSNTEDQLWGAVHWDPWWPRQRPSISELVAAAQAAGAAMAEAFRQVAPCFTEATLAAKRLQESMRRAGWDVEP